MRGIERTLLVVVGVLAWTTNVAAQSTLGAGCATDGDCTAGLACLSSDSTSIRGGGPTGGVCVADCSGGHSTACNNLGAVCVTVDDRGTAAESDDLAYCFEACRPGTSFSTRPKCHGRTDMACTSNPSGDVCLPACGSDADCGNRACDLGTGVCSSQRKPSPLPIGASCDPKDDRCSGMCINLGIAYYVCSGRCVWGVPGCGAVPNAALPLDVYCRFPGVTFASAGDFGLCAELCDTPADCAHPGAICEPAGMQFRRETGRGGFCTAKVASPDASVDASHESSAEGGDSTVPLEGGAGGPSGASPPRLVPSGAKSDSGCGCRFVRDGHSNVAPWITFALALLGRRLRR